LLRTLSRELEKRHRLVQELGEVRVVAHHLSRYRFAHALFQQYLYHELSAGERRLLHGEIAEILEALYGDQAEEVAVQLAYHFTQGEAWEEAFRYLLLSGDRACQAYASREAIAFYTQAEEVSRRITPALDAAQLLPIYEGRGLVWILLTKYDEAITDFQSMLRMARTSRNQRKEGESLCHLANVHFLKLSEDQLPFLEQYAQEALRLSQQTGDQRILAGSLTNLGYAAGWRGNLREVERKIEESLQISRREEFQDYLTQTLFGLSTTAYWQGKFPRVMQLGHEGVTVAREIHDGLNELQCLAFLCLSCWSAGNYTQALDALHEGMTKAKEWENKFVLGRLTNTLGWFHSEFGDFSRALEYDQASADLGRVSGISNVEISALINLGLDHLGLGQHARALSYLEPTLERVEREAFGAHRWRWKIRLLIGLAVVHYSTGAYEEALRYVEEGLKEAQATTSQKYVAKGWALRGKILAHLGNTEAAGADLQRAFSLAEQLNSPSLTYPIACDLGQWYESARRERDAVMLYARARDAIERMVTSVEDEALRSIFLQSALVQAINDSLMR
jgi:tetratricopeptide (TPR) repeat protein